ncbi:MAG TPA: chorismate-binding protein, partial [Puia sp.]|nr:chorismate-binding protein [Puia sp.]
MKAVLTKKKMTFDRVPSDERSFVSFPITEFLTIKRQMLTWASHVGIFCFLDSQDYPAQISPGFDCLLAAGAAEFLEAPAGNAFAQLKDWATERRDWIFGHFASDLAVETEPPPGGAAPQARRDPVGFPDLYFFIPRVVFRLSRDSISIGSLNADQEAVWNEIRSIHPQPPVPGPAGAGSTNIPAFTAGLTRQAYLDRLAVLQRHIHRGDCYEVNFCQEFFSQPAELDPLAAWWRLSQVTPGPFSCLYRLEQRWLLCASPERYLKKTGDAIWSQPMKGTAARHPAQPEADEAARTRLLQSEKDRSENV